MRTCDAFSGCHPLVNFFYFALVLLCSMFLLHPVSLAISLGCAFVYAWVLKGRQAVHAALWYVLPLMALAAVVNPAFNHAGVTILTYLPDGNPLTLESILYGLGAAAMLAAVVLWLGCCTAVLTADKFVYLFGRVIPVCSLLLSMTLRFLPKFKMQFDQVRQAQKCVGRDVENGSLLRRMNIAVTIFSMMITWSMENAIETADSMKSRGYGLPGRTAFSIYTFARRDRLLLLWLGACGVCLLGGWASGGFSWQYYPMVKGALTGVLPISLQAVYLALCLTPLILDAKEARQWKRSQSNI